MYKRVKKAKLGRKMAHRNSLRQNLLISLLQRGQVETTSPKAKILKSDMSSLLEEGKTKSEDLNFTKKIHNTLGNSELIKKFSEYVKSEKVGVTIVKIGFRAGDNACLLYTSDDADDLLCVDIGGRRCMKHRKS